MSMQFHSRHQDKEPAPTKTQSQIDYEKSFEHLLGKSKISDQEKEHRDEAVKEKIQQEQEAKVRFEQDKHKYEQEKQQAFEDLLNGKTPKKSTDQMSLQELFKEFYQKAKTTDIKQSVNSASSSLNSFSSLLERRRKQAQDKKEQKTEVKEEAKKDESTQKFTEESVS